MGVLYVEHANVLELCYIELLSGDGSPYSILSDCSQYVYQVGRTTWQFDKRDTLFFLYFLIFVSVRGNSRLAQRHGWLLNITDSLHSLCDCSLVQGNIYGLHGMKLGTVLFEMETLIAMAAIIDYSL